MTTLSLDSKKNEAVRDIYHYACEKVREFPQTERALLCMLLSANFASEAVFLEDDFVETKKGDKE